MEKMMVIAYYWCVNNMIRHGIEGIVSRKRNRKLRRESLG